MLGGSGQIWVLRSSRGQKRSKTQNLLKIPKVKLLVTIFFEKSSANPRRRSSIIVCSCLPKGERKKVMSPRITPDRAEDRLPFPGGGEGINFNYKLFSVVKKGRRERKGGKTFYFPFHPHTHLGEKKPEKRVQIFDITNDRRRRNREREMKESPIYKTFLSPHKRTFCDERRTCLVHSFFAASQIKHERMLKKTFFEWVLGSWPGVVCGDIASLLVDWNGVETLLTLNPAASHRSPSHN